MAYKLYTDAMVGRDLVGDLHSLDHSTATALGRLPSDLLALGDAELTLAPTLVIRAQAFLEWQAHAEVPASVIDALLGADLGVFSHSPHLMIRATVQAPFNGLDDKVKVNRAQVSLLNGIQRVYRSWGSSVARGNRAVLRVPDESNLPTLLIQPFVESPCSVITRHAVYGSVTSALDYSDNINNNVPAFTAAVSRVVAVSDRVLLRPVKVSFAIHADSGETPYILSVADETMTALGRCRALVDLLKSGRIDDARFLRGFQPDILGYVAGYELDTTQTSTHISGIPASPGFAHAQLAFRPPNVRSVRSPCGEPFIFVVEEATPDDIQNLEASCGAIGLRGGMTNHLAQTCRAMGIPAVTSCGGRIDYKARVLHLETGEAFAESHL